MERMNDTLFSVQLKSSAKCVVRNTNTSGFHLDHATKHCWLSQSILFYDALQ